jgi:hypothetical protein
MNHINVHEIKDRFAFEQLFEVEFRWPYGGNKAYIAGSFDDWIGRYEMSKNNFKFKCIIMLPAGTYEYKFIVDDKWYHDSNYPTVMSNIRTINNHIIVGRELNLNPITMLPKNNSSLFLENDPYLFSEDSFDDELHSKTSFDDESHSEDSFDFEVDYPHLRYVDRSFSIQLFLMNQLRRMRHFLESENYSINQSTIQRLNAEKKNIVHGMNTLIGINFEEIKVQAKDKINDVCAICLVDFKDDQNTLYVILQCSHLFHRDCIIQVENNKCPLCKEPIINISY